MSANFNKVLLMGNLTRDPELRYLPSGQPVTTFTIAVNRNYVAQSGEKKEDTSFIRVVVWARRAEVCNEYLRKGSPVFVEGRLQSRSWEAQDGSKRSTIEVVAANVQFLPRGGGGQQDNARSGGEDDDAFFEGDPNEGKGSGSVSVSDSEMKPDDEIPF